MEKRRNELDRTHVCPGVLAREEDAHTSSSLARTAGKTWVQQNTFLLIPIQCPASRAFHIWMAWEVIDFSAGDCRL